MREKKFSKAKNPSVIDRSRKKAQHKRAQYIFAREKVKKANISPVLSVKKKPHHSDTIVHSIDEKKALILEKILNIQKLTDEINSSREPTFILEKVNDFIKSLKEMEYLSKTIEENLKSLASLDIEKSIKKDNEIITLYKIARDQLDSLIQHIKKYSRHYESPKGMTRPERKLVYETVQQIVDSVIEIESTGITPIKAIAIDRLKQAKKSLIDLEKKVKKLKEKQTLTNDKHQESKIIDELNVLYKQVPSMKTTASLAQIMVITHKTDYCYIDIRDLHRSIIPQMEDIPRAIEEKMITRIHQKTIEAQNILSEMAEERSKEVSHLTESPPMVSEPIKESISISTQTEKPMLYDVETHMDSEAFHVPSTPYVSDIQSKQMMKEWLNDFSSFPTEEEEGIEKSKKAADDIIESDSQEFKNLLEKLKENTLLLQSCHDDLNSDSPSPGWSKEKMAHLKEKLSQEYEKFRAISCSLLADRKHYLEMIKLESEDWRAQDTIKKIRDLIKTIDLAINKNLELLSTIRKISLTLSKKLSYYNDPEPSKITPLADEKVSIHKESFRDLIRLTTYDEKLHCYQQWKETDHGSEIALSSKKDTSRLILNPSTEDSLSISISSQFISTNKSKDALAQEAIIKELSSAFSRVLWATYQSLRTQNSDNLGDIQTATLSVPTQNGETKEFLKLKKAIFLRQYDAMIEALKENHEPYEDFFELDEELQQFCQNEYPNHKKMVPLDNQPYRIWDQWLKKPTLPDNLDDSGLNMSA